MPLRLPEPGSQRFDCWFGAQCDLTLGEILYAGSDRVGEIGKGLDVVQKLGVAFAV